MLVNPSYETGGLYQRINQFYNKHFGSLELTLKPEMQRGMQDVLKKRYGWERNYRGRIPVPYKQWENFEPPLVLEHKKVEWPGKTFRKAGRLVRKIKDTISVNLDSVFFP